MSKEYETSKERGKKQLDRSYYPTYGFSQTGPTPPVRQMENYKVENKEKGRRWYLWFLLFGTLGVFFECLIGVVMDLVYNPYFFIYYNGFKTSVESFILFGLFGCLGLRAVLTRYDLIKR